MSHDLTPAEPASDDPFAFRVSVPVRFRDIDVGGHVHHSHVLAYMEEARLAYWTRVAGGRVAAGEVDHILAEVRVRYRARILYPETLSVGVRTDRIGRSSVELVHEVRTSAGQVAAEGTAILVLYDYDRGAPVAVPESLRARLEGHGGRGEEAGSGRWGGPGWILLPRFRY